MRLVVIDQDRTFDLPTREQVPQWLREARRRSGLSLAEVARRVGDVSRQPVHMWERGSAAPSAYHLMHLVVMFAPADR